jgi:hypothetical protein
LLIFKSYIKTMEGCLYQNYNTNSYCLVDSVASQFVIIIDLETFKQQFVQKDAIKTEYELIHFNSRNLLEVLYKYEMFQNKIDMCDFKDFDYIVFDERRYYIKNWRDVYHFIVNSN